MHPCVQVATNAGSLFDYNAATYTVYLDKHRVFTASKLSVAVIGMLALYFVFGVRYPSKLIKTCTFLASHVLCIPEPQLSAVQVLFNALSK
jgi:hypothetical protein